MAKHIFAFAGVIVLIIGAAIWLHDPTNKIVPILFVAFGTIITFLGWLYNNISIGPLPQRLRNVLIILVIVLLSVGSTILALHLPDLIKSIFPGPKPTVTTPVTHCTLSNGQPISIPSFPNGIGVTQVKDGDYGISNGSIIFDTNRKDGNLKQQAAEQMKKGSTSAATSLWAAAVNSDPTDAEAHIYEEDFRVQTSGAPHITLVVGGMFTRESIDGFRFILQGTYIAQQEYNREHDTQIILLIANSDHGYASQVACQITQAAQSDSTIKGVMGWPNSAETLDAVRILSAAHIPMVSPTSSSNQLSNISSYFFRISPPDARQGSIGAGYAWQHLHAKHVVVFVDPMNPYSETLASAFEQQFIAITHNPNSIIKEEDYTVRHPLTAIAHLNDALHQNPDLIFFAGYSSDVNPFLDHLPTSGQFATLKVMGGDALYLLSGGYPQNAYGRFFFTAFAFPDMWNASQKAIYPFFCDYSLTFDPETACPGPNTNISYGHNRAHADSMSAYDAMNVLLKGCDSIMAKGKKTFTPENLRDAIAHLKPFQGVTGRIQFVNGGDPFDKVVVVLHVGGDGRTGMDDLQGCLQMIACG